MNICYRNHEEICFEVRDCPLCKAQKEIETLNNTILDLEDALEEEIIKLEKEK